MYLGAHEIDALIRLALNPADDQAAPPLFWLHPDERHTS